MMTLEDYFETARQLGASSIILTVGQPAAFRVAGEVQTPYGPRLLSWQETAALVEEMMLPKELAESLESDGAVEFPLRRGAYRAEVSVYFGQGAHNIVFRVGL
jgi:Tfp pilus assembly pilus retraction ATPase PilT